MLVYTPLTKKAMRIAFDVHKNQTDKTGLPYIYHPFEVASALKSEYEICVALLHDVVEDSSVTLDELAKDFPVPVIEALRLLTHDKAVPYMDYVRAIKPNALAKAVKLADLQHNSMLERLDTVTEKDRKRAEKYQEAYRFLTDADNGANHD